MSARRLLIALALTLLGTVTSPIRAAGQESCDSILKASDDPPQNLHHLVQKLLENVDFLSNPFRVSQSVPQMTQALLQMNERYHSHALAQREAFDAQRDGRSFDPGLAASLMHDAEEVLKKPSSFDSLYISAVANALRYVVNTSFVHQAHENLSISENRQPEENKKSDENQKSDSGSDERGPSEEAPEPDIPGTEYQAGNEDFNRASGNGSRKYKPIFSINKASIPMFISNRYQHVDPLKNRWIQIPLKLEPPRYPSSPARFYQTVHPTKRKGPVRLAIAFGFVPEVVDSQSLKVWQDSNGLWFYESTEDVPKIPLRTLGEVARALSPLELEGLTRKSAVPLEAWPASIQQAVRELLAQEREGAFEGPQKNRTIAKILAAFISSRFKYRAGKPEGSEKNMSAMELCVLGAFQCSTASTIGATLLRDHFGIPCEIVGGLSGHENARNPGHSYAVSGPPLHAMVAVYENTGEHELMDFTPATPDVEEKRRPGNGSDYQPIAQVQPPQKSEQEDATGNGTLLEQLIEKEVRRRKEVSTRETTKKSDADAHAEKNNKDMKSDIDHSEFESTAQAKQKANIDQYLTRLERANPFVLRLLKRILVHATDPEKTSAEQLDRIHMLKNFLNDDPSGYFRSYESFLNVVSDATLLFSESQQTSRLKWLGGVSQSFSHMSLMQVHDEIARTQRQLMFHRQFLDNDERKPLENLINEIFALRRALQAIRHPDSKAINIARDLYENLPGVHSRAILSEQFGLPSVLGPDLATLAFSKAISENKLADHRLAALLGPMTRFMVRPIFKPSRDFARAWDEETNPLRRKLSPPSILLTGNRRLEDHFVRLYPHLTDEQALARGMMGVWTRRRLIAMNRGSRSKSPKKVTVLAFDTSASMSKNPALFQSMYIQALADRALSERDEDGNLMHKVFLIPFDDVPKHMISVTTPGEVKYLIQNIQGKTGNTGGGTNIQAALLKAAETIELARLSGDQELARATVVLCSDGEAAVDPKTVREAFQRALGPNTESLFAFVAINKTNSDLMHLVKDSGLGDVSMYLEYPSADITRLISEANSPPEASSDFWSESGWNQLPRSVRDAFTRVEIAARDYVWQQRTLMARLHSKDQRMMRSLKDQLAIRKGEEKVERRLNRRRGAIEDFRLFLNSVGPKISTSDRSQLIAEVLRDLEPMMGVPASDYDAGEEAALHWIFDWEVKGKAGR